MQKKKPILIALALVALGVGVYLVVAALAPATRFTYGVYPVSEREAILLTRRNEDDATFFWVQLVSDDGALGWVHETTPLEPEEALGFSGVDADDERVVVIGRREAQAVVRALSRASGERLWETALGPSDLHHIGRLLLIDGARVYVVYDQPAGDGTVDQLVALALETGAELWRMPPPTTGQTRRLELALIAPGRLLVWGDLERGAIELDGTSGEVRRALALWMPCPTPSAILGLKQGRLVVAPHEPRDAEPHELSGTPVRITSGVCGARARDFVFATASGEASIGLVRVDPATGAPRWAIDLGPRLFEETVTLDGRLPRFLPLSVFGSDGADTLVRELVVVDLDEGRVVTRERSADHIVPFATAARAYVMAQFRSEVRALDPETGRPGSARRLHSLWSAEPRAEDYRFGRLWLIGDGWAAPDELPWGTIDLVSGQARLHGGLTIEDLDAAAPASPSP